ncbi:MAG: hypothetical protein SH857_10760 [Chitinophagales bacterium]|nr:hypothetical protein [Chitinophagales bacterium]
MIKDIPFNKVEDIAVAVAPSTEGDNAEWVVYLVNMKDRPIDSVLINSKGYGTVEGKEVKTSSLRQFFDKIEGRDFVQIEILPEQLIGLSNQFWVSFWQDGILYDKQYIFVTESLVKDNLINIPVLNRRGVMIK